MSPCSDAHAARDDLARLTAHALDWLTTAVPTAVAIASPVDRRLRLYAGGPVIVRADGRDPAPDIERLLFDYLRQGRALDPFAPSRWSHSARTVVSAGDVGGDGALARSSYVELLAAHGLAVQASMFFRERGRIVAAIVLLRRSTQAEATREEIGMLRRCQPFVEHALAVSRRTPGAADEGLAPAALTRRELEVARLAATGVTNAEIARALFLGVPTVKTHMTHAMVKLDVRSRTELVARMASLRERQR